MQCMKRSFNSLFWSWKLGYKNRPANLASSVKMREFVVKNAGECESLSVLNTPTIALISINLYRNK